MELYVTLFCIFHVSFKCTFILSKFKIEREKKKSKTVQQLPIIFYYINEWKHFRKLNINRTSGELLFLREDNNGTLEEKLL